VIYDGNPSAGPMRVDVTAPIIPVDDAAITADPSVRHEVAHREAFVRLTRSEAEPSELWRAYEAVEQWVLARDMEIAAAPRKVYYTDFFYAAAQDDVCDIAWPVK